MAVLAHLTALAQGGDEPATADQLQELAATLRRQGRGGQWTRTWLGDQWRVMVSAS